MKKIESIVEKSADNLLWGRVTYNDNLITDTEETVEQLENSIKRLLVGFEGVDPGQVLFDVKYDVYAGVK